MVLQDLSDLKGNLNPINSNNILGNNRNLKPLQANNGTAFMKPKNESKVSSNNSANSYLKAGGEAHGAQASITMQELATSQKKALDFIKANGWEGMTFPDIHWIQFEKGSYKLKDEDGYTNKTYKIFVQPDLKHFGEAIEYTAVALDKIIRNHSLSGAIWKIAKVNGVLGEGFGESELRKPTLEKIVIYANSQEDMEEIVRSLNSQFGEKAFDYGTERDLNAYGPSNGAKFTYGISPLVHVRLGGAGHHNNLYYSRQIKGENTSKPQDEWAIKPEIIDELRKDASRFNMEKAPKFKSVNQKINLHNSEITLNPSHGTIDLYLAGEKHLQIVKTRNWNVPYLLIDPAKLDVANERGFKTIREDKEIHIGRDPQINAGRFEFPDTISRDHLTIVLHNGKITIKDISSNGTVILLNK
ncbi:FHA domain-containing regulatory protein [Candidatus Mancarchaeum acidiphilum]|uniref:FHA domain-containing regulatory protein n=1 Tax=Candidatus Mancarchaeum acidiphilum TaxID=1920749 RepID=A0A218NMC9_9ARCH|nr:FHA domain-containing protein [Candidatus Mancarchaeum acidiphilum]ASI13619.1 FHA domain-containing regulatory protein [Candidatus Mancarchaeum acidiphilum]